MSNDTTYQPDDRDVTLARQLGEHLDGQTPIPEADPLYTDLQAFKATQAPAVSEETSARLWHQIAAQTTQKSQARIYPMGRWLSIAASLLVLFGLSWWLFLRPTANAQWVATAGDTIFTYTADDGSVITLRPHSTLERLPSEGADVAYQLTGEGFFDITHDPNRTVSVQINTARIEVLGTRFNVRTWGTETGVFLETGRIALTHADTRTILNPGEEMVIAADGTWVGPKPTTAGTETDWLHAELVANATPLRDVLAELGHHYRLTFDAPEALLAETITGGLSLENKQMALGDLMSILNAELVELSETHYRLVPH